MSTALQELLALSLVMGAAISLARRWRPHRRLPGRKRTAGRRRRLACAANGCNRCASVRPSVLARDVRHRLVVFAAPPPTP